MHYQVSRNGQTYGPYTLEDLQRYVTSGNVLPTDLAKSEEMAEWLPVSQILAGQQTAPAAAASQFASPGFADPTPAQANYGAPAAPTGNLAASPYPDAPNLHWGLVLLFACLTCWLFMPIWNMVISAWLKRVQPNATALFWYIGVVVVLFISFIARSMTAVHYAVNSGNGTNFANMGPLLGVSGIFGLLLWVVRLVARYSERASLQEHFNTVEPVGLDLNPVLTFFFGGVYFQSQINRINAMKQAARFGSGRTF